MILGLFSTVLDQLQSRCVNVGKFQPLLTAYIVVVVVLIIVIIVIVITRLQQQVTAQQSKPVIAIV